MDKFISKWNTCSKSIRLLLPWFWYAYSSKTHYSLIIIGAQKWDTKIPSSNLTRNRLSSCTLRLFYCTRFYLRIELFSQIGTPSIFDNNVLFCICAGRKPDYIFLFHWIPFYSFYVLYLISMNTISLIYSLTSFIYLRFMLITFYFQTNDCLASQKEVIYIYYDIFFIISIHSVHLHYWFDTLNCRHLVQYWNRILQISQFLNRL